MKRKIISSAIIFMIILSIVITSVMAATNICKIATSVSKNSIKAGEEVKVVVSMSDITEPVAGVGFSLEYDASKFELVSAVASDGWMSSNVENLYTLLTSTFEGTKTAGNIMTITLKAKSTIVGTTTEKISLISTQISKEDSSIEELGTISQNVTITGTEQNSNVINGTTNTTSNTTTNTNVTTNTTNTSSSTTRNTSSTTTTTNTTVKNTSTTNTTKVTTNTNSSTSKMPNTGANDTLLFAIIGVATIGGISYLLYRKNNVI